MSYGIGANVEVVTVVHSVRWIYPGERGRIVGRRISPMGQEVYDVELEDGKAYVFVSDEIRELIEA